MADQLSASELRANYHKGGKLSDDALSASELKARAGIKPNRKNFSTGDAPEGGAASGLQGLLLLSAGVALLAVLAAYALGYVKV
jgi:hypothetical protein